MKKGKAACHYTIYVGNCICEDIASGKSLKQAIEKIGMMTVTVTAVYKWLDQFPSFKEKYERARQLQADAHADRLVEMAEEVLNNPQKSSAYKVAADILQWQAAMRNPKTYSPKMQVENKLVTPVDPKKLKEEIANLERDLNVDTTSTRKSRDAETQPAPKFVDPDPLSPTLFDDPIGPVQ